MWGALIGDACGATLEFKNEITFDDALEAMKMPGGGKLRVGAGQITDDGELCLALWSALTHSSTNEYPIDAVARAYGLWYQSIPFDIGRTCSFAFEVAANHMESGWAADSVYEIIREVKDLNGQTEANGALMRASPIAAWYALNMARHDDIMYIEKAAQDAADAAEEDARLSHPGKATRSANMVYVYALTLLLLGRSPSIVITKVECFARGMCPSVYQRLEESKKVDMGDFTENVRHVRHAFTAAFWFLRRPEIDFETAIRMVLMKGGDTDTNAAIVGAMVASYQPIPLELIGKVYAFDCQRPDTITTGNRRYGIERPVEYGVRYQLPL